MSQVLQIVGAVLLLAGFTAAQLAILNKAAPAYLVVNLMGSAILAVVAFTGRNWGFLLLESSWALISLAGLLFGPAGADPRSDGWLPAFAHDPHRRSRSPKWPSRPSRSWRESLPPARAAQFAGDELSSRSRLTRLFRDSYSGAQGRQWLQPHILWWILKVLRCNGIQPDWHVIKGSRLAQSITSLGLPPGHVTVHPSGQPAMNFGFWWPAVEELAGLVYRPRHRRSLPDAAGLQQRAWELGLRPWMSSASQEEMSGIVRALAVIREHDRHGRLDPDELMVSFLLPELLIAELHWLHAVEGRPRGEGRPRVEVVLLSQHVAARSKWERGQYLTPLEHMYLRAGDILNHILTLPADESLDPLLLRIAYLHRELRDGYQGSTGAEG